MAGVIARGIKAPLIKAGDDLVRIIVDSLANDSKLHNYKLQNNDIICITEAVIARSDNNYASVFDIARDVKKKFPSEHVGVVFPIFSRNRFETCLRGIALGAKEVTVVLNYPRDEVGNALVSEEEIIEARINPYVDTLTLEEFKKLFKESKHPITGVDYVELYITTIEKAGAKARIIFSNDVTSILSYTKDVLISNIHKRNETRDRLLKIDKTANVLTLAHILNEPTKEHGYNEQYGLLGTNKASEDRMKMFPKNAKEIVEKVRVAVKQQFNVYVEVLAFGDGAFKDPSTQIWELADPVVGLAYTPRLQGLHSEVKLKYLVDEKYKHLKDEELEKALQAEIAQSRAKMQEKNSSLGTTPRQFSDLLGSLSDLVMGSGDKGTPFVLVQNYFEHY
ncbi:MAG: coenzyme F420-0:L-glutamate ligase [Bacilli bacterium]|jgi:F420-0:gamma-glutamyl ligase|nr:coenzyme F420-0:L-glutamate ligase [Bacilli bacterium]